MAVLAGRFGDELLGPGAEILQRPRRDDRHLVAASFGGLRHGGAELDAGVLGRRHVRSAGAHHDAGALEEVGHVVARGRRRREPEGGQDRVAPADLRIAMEDLPVACLARRLLGCGARIGHGDEMAAGLLLADGPLYAVEEVVLEHVRLEGRARFRRDDEQGPREVDRLLDRLHLRRVGRIEDAQLREARPRAEGLGQHLGAEAGPAHAEQHGVGEARGLHVLGEIA